MSDRTGPLHDASKPITIWIGREGQASFTISAATPDEADRLLAEVRRVVRSHGYGDERSVLDRLRRAALAKLYTRRQAKLDGFPEDPPA